MTKTELRKHYRNLRASLSETDEAGLNLALLDQLKSLDWQNVKFCHVFLPISKYHEPNTFLLISYLQENYPQIQLVVSKSDLGSNVMSHYHYSDTLSLVHNKWGILEPTDGVSVNEKSVDRVLVPLLVSDIFGHRVGYGKGYYDRFLALCRPDVEKVGLSFFEPIALIADIDKHDIPLDICVTPTTVHHY